MSNQVKYSTIRGHEPLRVPKNWNPEERAFVAQLERILDDIFKKFGRIRFTDLGKELQEMITASNESTVSDENSSNNES